MTSRIVGVVTFVALALLALTASAQTVYKLAENNVQVAMVQVNRTPQHTEVHLKTLISVKDVCWYSSGQNSPYLLANARRYRFISGDNITACPAKRGYQAQEVMVLRFQPLESQVNEISLVEGEGGENQMINPKSSNETFWNFLRINLNR
jgi:hypothetical protein